jgi:hypothetical protein
MMCCARGRADPEGDSAEDCGEPDDASGGAGAEELSAPGAFEDEEHPDSTTTSATATAPTAIPQARRGVGECGRGCSGGVTGFLSGRCHRGLSPRSGTVQRRPQLSDASVDRDPEGSLTLFVMRVAGRAAVAPASRAPVLGGSRPGLTRRPGTFPAARSDGDRLQHLRSILPCEVGVTGSTHPLSGRRLWASGFTRLNGVLNLIVDLPDGSPGTIRASATDVFGESDSPGLTVMLDVGGVRALRRLTATIGGRARPGGRPGERK